MVGRRARAGSLARVGVLFALIVGLAPTRSSSQRIGLFFDEAATSCNAPLEYFGQQHLYVVGFPPVDSLLGGALLSLERPADTDIVPGSVRIRRDVVFDVVGQLDQMRELDIRFRDCIQSAGPLVMLEFDIYELSPVLRNDLILHLVGAGTDSLALKEPHWKICDPGDPERFTSLVTAPAVDAVFNCTHACYCTTPVSTRTWAAVKSLYQGN